MRGAGTGRGGGYRRGVNVVVQCCFNRCCFIEIIKTVYMWGLMFVEGFLSVGFEFICMTGKQGGDRPET